MSTMLGTASRGVAEELQAHRCGCARHAVHHPARAGDQAVAAFLLDAGQAAQELVGDVLAQAFLAEARCRECPAARCAAGVLPSALKYCSSKLATSTSWILPRLWLMRGHFQPLGLRRHHAPAGQVVQRGAPQHGLFAAGVHGDVAADARGLGRRRVHREHISRRARRRRPPAG